MPELHEVISKAKAVVLGQYTEQTLQYVKTWESQLAEFTKVIEHEKDKWCVRSEDGSKNLGCYGTKAEAVERLRQIEGHKKSASDFLIAAKAADVEKLRETNPVSIAIALSDLIQKLTENGFVGDVSFLKNSVAEFIDIFKGNAPSKDMDKEQLHAAQEKRSAEYGIEILEEGSHLTFPSGYPTDLNKFSDPVNLKYPVDTPARARNARVRFKQNADQYKKTESKRVVHERIVRAELKFGIKVKIDPDDALDKLLPQSLKDEAERSTSKKGLPESILDGGIHIHRLGRDTNDTKVDGAHPHTFIVVQNIEEIVNGVAQPPYERRMILYSHENGVHKHALPDSMANNTQNDGEHFHKVVFVEDVRTPNGSYDFKETELETYEDGAHTHQLQVTTTTLDGLHTHQLELPDGRVVTSATPSDIWDVFYDRSSQKDLLPLPPSSIFASLSDFQHGAMAAAAMSKAAKEPTVVQTLVFSKKEFETEGSVKKWAKDNDYKSGKVDETENSWRLRQRDPGDFKDDSFRTISLTDGVKAVIGHLKKADTQKVDFTKETLSALKMPDPRFLVKRLQLQMPAGLLSMQERRKRVGKEQVLVNELAPLEFDASFAWAIVKQEEPIKFDSFSSIPENLMDGLDPYTRKEFERTEEAVYYLPLVLVKSFDAPMKLSNPPPGRRLAGKVDLSKDTVVVSKCSKCKNPFENPNSLFNFCEECRVNESRVTKMLGKGLHVKVVKTEEVKDERIIFGAVLVPNEVDAQGDIYDESEVQKACFSFMEIYGPTYKIMHNGEVLGKKITLLENYLSKFDEDWNGDKYPVGTWFQGVRANDDGVWKDAKEGKLTGWSIGGTAIKESLD